MLKLTDKRKLSHTGLSYLDPEQDGNPKLFHKFMNRELPSTETKDTRIGKLIHQAVLEPDKFNYITFNKPSDIVSEIIDSLVNSIDKDKELNECRDELWQLANTFQYRTTGNWKKDTIISKLITEGKKYYNFLLKNKNKTIIDSNEYETIIRTRDSILASKVFENIVGDAIEQRNEELLEFTYQGYESKGYVDKNAIFADNTFSIIDLKITGKPITKYYRDFKGRKTYRQIAFYEHGIEQNNLLVHRDHWIVVAENCREFQVLPFKISRNYIEKGYNELDKLIERIKWHEENGWEYPMEIEKGFLLDCNY